MSTFYYYREIRRYGNGHRGLSLTTRVRHEEGVAGWHLTQLGYIAKLFVQASNTSFISIPWTASINFFLMM